MGLAVGLSLLGLFIFLSVLAVLIFLWRGKLVPLPKIDTNINLSLPVIKMKAGLKSSVGEGVTYTEINERNEPKETEMEMMPNSAYVPRSVVHDEDTYDIVA